ncbi:MAG: hypothetical protein EBV77_11215 [Gemmatimonadaceae bacterium]|nr:hypothetical protein [Gemmatimonadaceae bacterium]
MFKIIQAILNIDKYLHLVIIKMLNIYYYFHNHYLLKILKRILFHPSSYLTNQLIHYFQMMMLILLHF